MPPRPQRTVCLSRQKTSPNPFQSIFGEAAGMRSTIQISASETLV